MKNVFGIFLLVFSSRWDAGGGSCTQDDISNCARPLAAFNLTASTIVPTRTEEEMKNLCVAYDKVEDCLAKIEHECDAKHRIKLKTVDYQYDYICDKTFDEYLKHRECLANPDLHSDAEKCNATLTEHFESVRRSNRTRDFRKKRLCQYVYQYISCIHVTVRGYCSEEAALWQKGLDSLTVLPAFSSLNCKIFEQPTQRNSISPAAASASDGNETTMIIVAVIIVGVACLVLVGGMTAFFIHRKRKADRKRAAHEMLNITRRNPRVNASRANPSYDDEPITQEGAAGATSLPSPDFYAPPPYLEKDVPPPTYRNPPNYDARNPPNYDALFNEQSGATGGSVANLSRKDKV